MSVVVVLDAGHYCGCQTSYYLILLFAAPDWRMMSNDMEFRHGMDENPSSNEQPCSAADFPREIRDTTNTPIPVSEDCNLAKRVFIVTYSQADMAIFPTRRSFGMACVAAFGGGHVVKYFTASKEAHKAGGWHYHVAMLLDQSMRWKSARNFLRETYGVTVNFSVASEDHPFYDGAYAYVTKEDKGYYHGHVLLKHPKHSELLEAATNKRRLIAQKANAVSGKNAKVRKMAKTAELKEKKVKEKRPDRLDQLDFIVENNITDDNELLAAVQTRRNEQGIGAWL